MPFFYCHDEECEDFDHPQWTEGEVTDATCGKCKKGSCKAKPKVPPEVARKQAAGKKGGKVALPQSASRQLFYCQNPAQSGDSTGVGIALALFDSMNLMFFASRNNVQASAGYLTFYGDIAHSTSRIALVIGDEETELRKEREKQTEKLKKEVRSKVSKKTKLAESEEPIKKLLEEEETLQRSSQKLDKLMPSVESGTAPKTKAAKSEEQTLHSLDLAAFTKILTDNGWPKTPLIVPDVVVPSHLKAKNCHWAVVDYSTALLPITWKVEMNELLLAETASRIEALQREMKAVREELTTATDLTQLTAIEKRHTAIGAEIEDLSGALATSAETRRTASADLEALQSGTFELQRIVGRELPGLFERLKMVDAYGLYAVTPQEGVGAVLVIERGRKEASEAAKEQGGESFANANVANELVAGRELKRNRDDRFKGAKDIIRIRMARKLEEARALSSGYEQALTNAVKVRSLVGRIIPWLGLGERAANQLYQELTGVAVGLRDVILAKDPAEKLKELEDKSQDFQTIMRVGSYEYYPIGDTSRNVLALLQRDGLKALTARLYAKLAEGRAIVKGPVNEVLIEPFVKAHHDSRKERRLTMVLIWVRGLNDAEMAAVEKAKFTGVAVTNDSLGTINPHKRNPHHVMTAQLASQLTSLCTFFNESESHSPDPKRYFVPVLIGDPIRYDQYDAKSALYRSADEDNLIGYWNKKGLNTAVGGTHWRYRQLCAITELFNSSEFDVIQIGIRSGALEQGMYQGMPTIYIEEHFCTTGDRMGSLTWEGATRAVIDGIYRSNINLGSADRRSAAASLRERIDAAAAAGTLAELDLSDLGLLEDSRENIEKIIGLYKQIAKRPIYDSKPESPDLPEPLGGIYPPEPAAARRGFPHFYRLITRHLIGLNQARTAEALEEYAKWFNTKLRNPESDALPDERVYRGGLSLGEVSTLVRYLGRICRDYGKLREHIASMPVATTTSLPSTPNAARTIIGIQNTFNQCYLNSALQFCAALQPGTNYYLGAGVHFDANFSGPVSTFINNLTTEAGDGSYLELGSFGNASVTMSTQNTIALRTLLAAKCGWRTIERQEDAAEALTKILESFDVDRHLNASPDGLALLDAETFADQRPSRLHFMVNVRTTYNVAEGGVEANPAPAETWYELGDGGRINRRECRNMIQLSIDATTRTFAEVLERNIDRTYAVNEIETNNCVYQGRYYRNARRTHELLQWVTALSDYVVVQLKRFETGAKISTAVPNNRVVTMNGTQYTLIAFIVHLGRTLLGGHYIAYRLHAEHWYELDDGTVIADPLDVEAQAQNGYLFLYRRV